MIGAGVIGKTLRDQRGVTVGMSVTVLLIAVGMIALYPQFADQFADIDLPPIYEVFFGEASIDTPAGFFAAEFFGWVPLLIIAIAVIAGTAAIAGEESNGTIELLLAEPVTRRALLLRKTAGLMLSMAIIAAVSYAGMIVGRLLISEFDLGYRAMLEATLLMLLLVWFFLAFSILASASLPSRTAAATTVTALIVLAYLASVIASLIDAVAWLEHTTPFGWADYVEALLHGMPWIEAVALFAFTVAFTWLAVLLFERRDVGAATWPWQALRRRKLQGDRP